MKKETVTAEKYAELEVKFEDMRKYNITLFERLNKVEAENLSLSKRLDSKSDNEVEQYKQDMNKLDDINAELRKRIHTLEQEKTKNNKAMYQSKIDTLEKKIQELEQQLHQEKDKHSRKGTGRKRDSQTPDEEVIKLREKGKTVKAISGLTGVSSATINRILANSKSKLD